MTTKVSAIKTIVVSGLLSIIIFSSACKKVLEVEPYSFFTTANFFKTIDEAKMATLGVYEIMSRDATYGWYVPMVYDNATDVGQVSPGTSPDWRSVPNYLAVPETNFLYETWSSFYDGINRANLVIEKIPLMGLYETGSATEKAELNRMVGEAKFLRGFYYSELVRLWGDVPFKTNSSKTGEALSLGLTKRQDIYTHVIADMKEAADLLPATMPNDERVNKWAAKSILARVALFAGGYSLGENGLMQRADNYKEYYTLAQQLINEIMAANVYKLNNSFAQGFKNQCQHVLEPTENIFQVAFYNPVIYVRANTNNQGFFNAPLTATGVYGNTLNRCFTVRPFYNSFDTLDWRRDFAIATYRIEADGNKTQLFTGRGDESWTVAKWSREYQTNSNLERTYTHINTVIMRYADLLLMRAEVETELNDGPNQLAYDAINEVRRRAFGANQPGTKIMVRVVNAGTGYTANPRIEITGGGGTGAAAAVTTLSSGRIGTVVTLSGGSGYTSNPTVNLIGGGAGTGAVLEARLMTKADVARAELAIDLNKAQFMAALKNERAWELCFEGMRKADLIRWNDLATKISETETKVRAIRANYNFPTGANFAANKHELFPYPQNERDVNRNITRQNPGY